MQRRLALAINPGSSSFKFALYDQAKTGTSKTDALIRGSFVDINTPRPRIRMRVGDSRVDHQFDESMTDLICLDWLARLLDAKALFEFVSVVLVRAVHCGKVTKSIVALDAELLDEIRKFSAVVPLHVPPLLRVLKQLPKSFTHSQILVCPDTAFHQSIPIVRQMYAIDPEYYLIGFRRFGFHGLSFGYIQHQLKEQLAGRKAVICHLGSGSSLCAIEDGHSVNTTMGYSPLSGLPGATRSGDLDPALVLALAGALNSEDLGPEDLLTVLNQSSGLQALSRSHYTIKEIFESSEPACVLAFEYFADQLIQAIGSQIALLGGLDILVLTGGVGTGCERLQNRVREKLQWLGVGDKSNASSVKEVIVMETDETQQMLNIFRRDWKNATSSS